MTAWTTSFALLVQILYASSSPLKKEGNCECASIFAQRQKTLEAIADLFLPSNGVGSSCSHEESLLVGTHIFEFTGRMDAMEPCAPTYPKFEVLSYNCTAINDLVSEFDAQVTGYVGALKELCNCGCEVKNE
ncbi:hypothetical protein QR680_008953 [Steinernema hermaphroditum]|uniref:Uncharacterized protein n=1 Tax=Steinernema hermaphroditum TaxID=289476 RepID=A0AA39M8U2_9BILA|nr:hypothetical protein QR680_008953 [Steinernema hermaphroditum]